MSNTMLMWTALYTDGTQLHQYKEDGSENKYADIDRSRLKALIVLDIGVKPARTILAVHLDPNKKLICRFRVILSMKGDVIGRGLMVGWQENRNGVNVQMVSVVFPDGHVEIVDRFRDGHLWFDKPEHFLEGES